MPVRRTLRRLPSGSCTIIVSPSTTRSRSHSIREDVSIWIVTPYGSSPSSADDPDWTEEPAQIETIPDDDAVPERDRIPYEKPEVITVEQVAKIAEKTDTKTDKEKVEELILEIQSGERNPLKWNAREAVKLNDNGVGQRALAELYGISVPTVNKRLKEYRSKS